MKLINQEHTLWQDGNRSGSVDDPYFKNHVADGNPVDDYVVPIPSTEPSDYVLTRAQLRNMFVEDGKPANFIKTLVSAMPAGKPRERAIVMLEDTSIFSRDHILLVKIVAAELYTDAQIDTMWVAEGSAA